MPKNRRLLAVSVSSVVGMLCVPLLFGGCSATNNTAGGSNSDPDAGSIDNAALGGRSATTYTCESFPAADLLAAVQTVAPATTAGTVVTQALADEFGSALACQYRFAANLSPGHDPSTPEGQNVVFIVMIKDKSIKGIPTVQSITDDFTHERDRVQAAAKGDSTSDTQDVFLRVPGLGSDAYFDDRTTRQSGVATSVRSELYVLRASLPLSVDIDMNYAPLPPVPAADGDPFQNEMRHAMTVAFTKVVLSKM